MPSIFKRNAQLSIWNILKVIEDMPKVQMSYNAIIGVEGVNSVRDINAITISHENKFVPDFELEWCPSKKHFRVYILVGERTGEKKRAPYSILVISSRLEAAKFIDFYGFICRNRANNRESE